MHDYDLPSAWGILKYRDGAGVERIVHLTKSPFTIGRLNDNDLPLDDPYVSRFHVELIYDGADCRLVDRHSTSGSYVNSMRFSETALSSGDRLMFGRRTGGCELTFEYVRPGQEPPPADCEPRQVSVINHSQTRYLNTSRIREANRVNAVTIGRLQALYEITSAILSLKSREAMAERLLSLLLEILPAERGAILLTNGGGHDRLQPYATRHRGRADAPVLPSQTIVRRVFETNLAELCLDAHSDARFANRQSVILQSIRSVMCAPIGSTNRVWGVCYLDNLTNQKTFDQEELEFLLAVTRQAGMALENIYLLEEQQVTFQSFITTLAASIDARDDLTAGHSARVARYSRSVAKYLGLPPEQQRLIYYAGLLHDYGKIGTREAVLCKPGKLTEEEYEHMRSHARNTYDILSKIRFTKDMESLPLIAGSHHENYDGSGYPFGLRGEAIPIGARVIAVADFFDALTHRRHYREPMPIEEVIALIEADSGAKFDPNAVTALKRFVTLELLPKQRQRAEAEDARRLAETIEVAQSEAEAAIRNAETMEVNQFISTSEIIL
jgi:HD-GYP domain-containing protein (c-di-GMP phosphodiesterase class II)